MNETIKNLKTRRSIRKFQSKMIPKEMIEEIIEAGLYAANSRGLQSPIILAVTNKELRDAISKENARIIGNDNADPFYGAPVILVVLAPKALPNRVADGSLVMGNLMTAATSLGIGSIWIHRAQQEFEGDFGKDILTKLGIDGEWEGIGHCALGYVDGEVPSAAERKPNRVYWVE